MFVTATQISSYLYCPRKLFLEYVLGFETPDSEALLLGRLTHTTHELMNEQEEKLVKGLERLDSYVELLAKYRRIQAVILEQLLPQHRSALRGFGLDLPSTFDKIWPRIVWEGEERAQNVFQFHQEHQLLGEELWQKLTPKIVSEFRVQSQDLQLKGIVDQVKHFPDAIVPIELKTGKAPSEGIWEGHRLQVGVYLALLRSQKLNVKEGFVKYLDASALRPVVWTPFLDKEVFKIRDKVLELRNSTELPDFVENKNKCKSCTFQNQCYDAKFMDEKVNELKKVSSKIE
ncbi:MAG TPA: CRISPR-associated protein Cas4 [Candidatus Nanoarchaeia archaeon]|nr:CRISPR-associated protein Cas4 [Candidatus Nanoarchaeia archaeon]